jgi:hypothetical protein
MKHKLSLIILNKNYMIGVMVNFIAFSVVDCGFKPNTIKLVFVPFPLSMKH